MPMSVNRNIRKIRKERKITTTELAHRLGISQSSVVRYENGSVKYVPLDLINEMAGIFECSVNDLVEGDDRYTQKSVKKSASRLSEDERDLLAKYSQLSLKEKNAVKGLCDLLISSN